MNHILIIEDEPLLLWAIEQYLGKHGYVTSSAKTAADARRILKTENVDLIVTDVKLPDTSGVSLLEEIRRQHPRTPIVTITATPFADREVSRIKTLSSVVLGKPFEMRRLEEAIREILPVAPPPDSHPEADLPKAD